MEEIENGEEREEIIRRARIQEYSIFVFEAKTEILSRKQQSGLSPSFKPN